MVEKKLEQNISNKKYGARKNLTRQKYLQSQHGTYGHGLNAEATTRANHAARDLAAIRNQHLFEGGGETWEMAQTQGNE